jgi:hypothetical protein
MRAVRRRHATGSIQRPRDLTAFVDGAVRDCVPAGPITLQATANRFQIATVTAQVPGQGARDVPITMDCTMVTGRVLDSAGSPMAGEWAFLTDRQGNPLLDPNGNPYQTKTDLNGRFQFACVPHGEIKVSTDRDPSADQIVTIGPAGALIELVVQLTAATVIVRVVDADNNDQPIDRANVRLTTSDGAVRPNTTSGTPPQATFAAVLPAGTANVRATMTGYLPNTVPATIPASGTVTITVRLSRDVAVRTPTAVVMQLDWGAVPRDLDLHCSGPDNAGGRFHCLFNSMQPVPFVRLDVDDRDATGPERITVTQVAGAFVPDARQLDPATDDRGFHRHDAGAGLRGRVGLQRAHRAGLPDRRADLPGPAGTPGTNGPHRERRTGDQRDQGSLLASRRRRVLRLTPVGLYGRRKLTAHLRRGGLKVAECTVARYMKLIGHHGIRRGKRGPHHHPVFEQRTQDKRVVREDRAQLEEHTGDRSNDKTRCYGDEPGDHALGRSRGGRALRSTRRSMAVAARWSSARVWRAAGRRRAAGRGRRAAGGSRPANVPCRLCKVLGDAGIEGMSPHMFRRTAGRSSTNRRASTWPQSCSATPIPR